MRTMLATLTALLTVCGLTLAQQPEPPSPDPKPTLPYVKLPEKAKGGQGDFITVLADTNGKAVRWYSPDKELKVFPPELLKDSRIAVVTSTTPGTYRLLAWTALGDSPSREALCLVTVDGGAAPTPPDPKPKLPDPNPKPPDPKPPTPPEVLSELWVLLVYESSDISSYPKGQQNAMFGKEVRGFLNANCAKETDGNPAWRLYDKDANMAKEGKGWQFMMDRTRTLLGQGKATLPMISIGNGQAVAYEGPLPQTPHDTIVLISKYIAPKTGLTPSDVTWPPEPRHRGTAPGMTYTAPGHYFALPPTLQQPTYLTAPLFLPGNLCPTCVPSRR